MLAKAAVIAGSDAGMDLLDRPGVAGALLLLDTGEVIALPRTTGVAGMRYRGLDPRTRPLRWAVFLAAVVVILAATGGGAARCRAHLADRGAGPHPVVR